MAGRIVWNSENGGWKGKRNLSVKRVDFTVYA